MTAITPDFAPAAAPRELSWLSVLDFLFMGFFFFIASDAFTFLGLHSLFWLAAYGYAVLRIAMMFPRFLNCARRNWIFLLFPIMCGVSVLWTPVPSEAIRTGVQLSMTYAIAIFVGMRFSLRQIFVALAAVLAFCAFFSIANLGGALAEAYDHRGNFKGIFLSKNALGHRAVLLTATCVMGVFLLPGISGWGRTLLLIGLGINAFLISISGSATAVGLSGALTVTGAGLWILLLRRGGWGLMAAAVSPIVAVSVVFLVGFGVDPVSGTLELLGRDPSLTGRTYLWEIAISHLGDSPLLGLGVGGYWNNPAYQAEILYIQARYGEGVVGFHNIILEMLVMLGPLGLLVHTAAILVTFSRGVFRARVLDDPYAVWALTIVTGIYVMAQFGPQMTSQHALPLILLVTLGVSMGEETREDQLP